MDKFSKILNQKSQQYFKITIAYSLPNGACCVKLSASSLITEINKKGKRRIIRQKPRLSGLNVTHSLHSFFRKKSSLLSKSQFT